MKKSHPKLSWARLNIAAKIMKSKNILAAMMGNANFPKPIPDLNLINDAIDALVAAYEAARDGGKSLIASMNLRAAELGELMGHLRTYIDDAAQGDAEIIRSSGMEVKSDPAPMGLPAQVINLKASTSLNQGEVGLRWKTVKGAVSYVAEFSLDGSTNWLVCGHSTKAKVQVTGLTSLTNHWFRVAALGAAGQGSWSDPAKAIVS